MTSEMLRLHTLAVPGCALKAILMQPAAVQIPPPFAIEAQQVFDGERMIGPVRVEVVAGEIAGVHGSAHTLDAVPVMRLRADVILAPGFIDLQVNGGGGVLLNDDPSLQGVARIAAAHRQFGTTAVLPTLITDTRERMAALASIAQEAACLPGVAGFHLEGPYINPVRKGIHPAEHIRTIGAQDIELLQVFAKAGRSIVTLAPEMVSVAAIKALVKSGLCVSAGHSDASAVEVLAAADHGLSGITHLFNAMSQMTGRAPGLVGAAFADDRLMAGIICDGLHVDPLNVQAAYRAMGASRLMLVSDAMSLVGSVQCDFMLHGRTITLQNGQLTDASGILAGAHLTMIEAVRNAVTRAHVSLADALVMASGTPAKFLRLDDRMGRIAPGFRADMVAFDRQFCVSQTWTGGIQTALTEQSN
jgi:N-acetylglucosamine-6-phosphate deacetylase